MDNTLAYNYFTKVDFGDIDGYFDKKLEEYFIDENYWSKLVEGNKFFVIGRKGTGKSAICRWIKNQEQEKGIIVSNLSFKNFPFEKLLNLSDDDFACPNQYQSIWRNIIYSEIAKCIVLDANAECTEFYRKLKEYVEFKFGTNLIDLHSKVTRQTVKNERGLFLKPISSKSGNSVENEVVDELTNLSTINSALEMYLMQYLSTCHTSRYVIQFDQLDDNYTVYNATDKYFQSIISLFKVVYDINQNFLLRDIPVKVISYLRSDIFYEIDPVDAESARWDDYKLSLSWSIINRSDWRNPRLLEMIDQRIIYSIPELRQYASPFRMIFKDIKMDNNQSVFSYIVRRTCQRPRDVIQYCKKIQEQLSRWGKLNNRSIIDAEKDYSSWLLGEMANEIGPNVSDKKALFLFLRNLGNKQISYDEFSRQYSSYRNNIKVETDDLLQILYRLGIIINVSNRKESIEYYSIIRNEKSEYNKKLSFIINAGLIKGLHAVSV